MSQSHKYYRTAPAEFLMLVGRWRASTWAFQYSSDRIAIPPDTFGHRTIWKCDDCGPISEPDVVCVAKESWGFWGGSPAENESVCPSCGGPECWELEDKDHTLGMKLTRRYTTRLRHRSAA